jgi:tetratricopeptide (TPR) repeat protein
MKKSRRERRNEPKAVVSATSPSPVKKSLGKRLIPYAIGGVAVILVAIGVRFWLQGPDIPMPPAESLDNRLTEEIENARAQIWEAPREPERWGDLGMLLAAHSFPTEAVQCFDRAAKLDPANWCWPYLCSLALEQTDSAAARDALREAAVVAADLEPLPRLLLVERLLETGELDEAARHLDIALRYWPENARAKLNQARLLFLRDDAAGALVALKSAAGDRHTRRQAHQLFAQLHHRLGDQPAAEQALVALKSLPHDEPWPDYWREKLESFHIRKGALIARIHELGRRGEIETAHRTVIKSIERYPELAHLIGGRQRLAKGENEAAERVLSDALRFDPLSVDAMLSLGEALERQKKYSDAEYVLRRATAREPTNGETHLRLGRCLISQKQFDAAVSPLRTATHLMPTSPDAHAALADALSAIGKTDEADEHRRHADRLSALHSSKSEQAKQ